MDDSQRIAYSSALKNEFVLIHGPPGTGKTYVGLQIAKDLLQNRVLGTNQSLLVVCFTDHALDQYLEGLADFLPVDEIVRIGNQCKNPATEIFSIKHHRRNVHMSVIAKAEKINKFILRKKEILNLFRKNVTIATFHTLRSFIPDQYIVQFRDDPPKYWLEWLGVSVKAWFTAVKQRYNKCEVGHKQHLIFNQNDQLEANELYQENDDQQFTLNINDIGIDIPTQYASVINDIKDPRCLHILTEEANFILEELRSSTHASDSYMNETKQIWGLPRKERWDMYRVWMKNFLQYTIFQQEKGEKDYNGLLKKYKSAKLKLDENILRAASVIGMTSSFAASYNELLRRVCPIVAIIDGTAEVPEAHITSVTNQNCDHVILIGDHKQLKLRPALQELAMKHNLSLSFLKEMMSNGLNYHYLQEQHRMRPEIADLVLPIYSVLKDHLKDFDNIRGVKENLFFVDHQHDEQYNKEIKSFYNEHEAKFLLELFGYLLKQGYKNSEITILVAYTGQLLCIKEEIRKKAQNNIKVCVLDNYQGEENDIILLSLVRNNGHGDMGFLNKKYRICFALSRARMGLYIIGNSAVLYEISEYWGSIINHLSKKGRIGAALPLYCGIHLDKPGIMAKTGSDFNKSPEGGCHNQCEFRLKCGHTCSRFCHPLDQTHDKPCDAYVDHVFSKCGHTIKVPCRQKQLLVKNHSLDVSTKRDFSIECPCVQKQKKERKKNYTSVQFVFEDCDLLVFQYKYDTYFVCGHRRTITCKENASFREQSGPTCISCQKKSNKKKCIRKCTKTLLCGHKCLSSDRFNCSPCSERCTFSCEHSSCDNVCLECCVPCQKPCLWICPHYKCTRLCFEECDRPLCNNDCQKTMKCGHKCPGFCGEPCPMSCIQCNPNEIVGFTNSMKNKVVQLQECFHSFESSMLDEYMNTNIDSLITRCPECKTIIHKHPRYNMVLRKKKMLLEIAKKEIRTLTENGVPSYYFVDIINLSNIADYVLKFQTYVQILIYTDQTRFQGLELETLKCFAENTFKLVEYAQQLPVDDVEQWLSICDHQIFKMKVYWMLCLLDSDETIAFKLLRVISEPQRQTPLSNADEIEDDNYKIDRQDKLYSVEYFIKHVLDTLACNRIEDVEEYLDLLATVIKDKEYTCCAMNIPKLKIGSTIHEDDWKMCANGNNAFNNFTKYSD